MQEPRSGTATAGIFEGGHTLAMLSRLSASAIPLGWRVTVRGAVVSSLQQQAGSVAQDDHTSETTPRGAMLIARRASCACTCTRPKRRQHTSQACHMHAMKATDSVSACTCGRAGGLDTCGYRLAAPVMPLVFGMPLAPTSLHTRTSSPSTRSPVRLPSIRCTSLTS